MSKAKEKCVNLQIVFILLYLEMITEHTGQILWISVGVLTVIQLLYLYIVYNAVHRRNVADRKGKIQHSEQQQGVSVIIVAADNEEQLAENLPHILTQDYPDYEVIVVDDNSQDDTKELLKRLSEQYPHLYRTFTSDSVRYISHKKLALTLGIKAAKKEWLLFTDPDCYPTSNQWISRMARQFTNDTDVVIGYSNYERKSGFANWCYMYDMLLQQLRLLGLTLRGRGYMGIGRNMAYRRELFFRHKGYSSHLDLQRGEDDLFINEHVPAHRIAAEVSIDATVRCTSANTYTWSADKLSRLFTRSKMHSIAPYLMGAETLSRVLLYTSIVAGIAYGIIQQQWIMIGVCAGLWALRYACQTIVFHKTAHDLGERRYNVSLALFDLLQPLWDLYFSLRLLCSSKRAHLRNKI